jgi:phage-related protein
MKKLILGLLLVFAMLVSNAQKAVEKTLEKTSDGIAAVHDDIVNATSTMYNDAANAVKEVYPDAKGAVGTVYSDLKGVTTYLTPKVEGAITSIASALKVTVAEVWRILIYKQISDAVSNLIIGVFLIIASIFCIKYLRTSFNCDMDDIGVLLQTIFSLIFLVAAGTLVITNIHATIQGLLVPEYGALQEVTAMTERLLKSWH